MTAQKSKKREPKPKPPRAAWDIKAWLYRRNLSYGWWYRAAVEDRPEVILAGGKRLITEESDAAWHRRLQSRSRKAAA